MQSKAQQWTCHYPKFQQTLGSCFSLDCGKCYQCFHASCVKLPVSLNHTIQKQLQLWVCRQCAITAAECRKLLGRKKLEAAADLCKSADDCTLHHEICRLGEYYV
jgi:hypothetical protein